MKILSCGAGMQSTALALMSVENKIALMYGCKIPHPLVPIYDAIIYCDLGHEPPWVYTQVDFIKKVCDKIGIPFYILDQKNLYEDYMENFGKTHVKSIPFWTVDPETGKKGMMRRICTLDYKIYQIQRFVRYTLLNYRYRQHIKKEDVKAHEIHIGFSSEESSRASENTNKMFTNLYPLIEMGKTRKDNYAYILEVWGLDTKASACIICPFHRNFFFYYLKDNHPDSYSDSVKFDRILETNQPKTAIRRKLYISRSRKRIEDLQPSDCCDAETFEYKGRAIWNGF